MNIYSPQLLENHYKDIFVQHKETIMRGGVGDEYLLLPDTDTRMALALLIRIDKEVSQRISAYLDELRRIEPDLYFYPEEDFHITVLDILRGVPGRIVPENIEDYVRCIKECAKKITPFYVEFNGMTASDNAALVCGYYEYELEKLREELREAFADNNLLLEERYKSFSAHITVARTPDKLTNPSEFIRAIQAEKAFGKMKVESLELVFHNWYDSKKTVLAKVDLKE